MSNTENIREQKSFLSTAIRSPKQSVYERLLAQNLISAVSAKPLTKIRLITEAAMMIERIEESAKKKNFDSFVQDVVFGQLIQKIYNQERKIALLKRVEIVKSTLFEGK